MINSVHPLYTEQIADWQLLRDSYKGEDAIKRKGVAYLPPTGGQLLDGMNSNDVGYANYQSYKTRAVYPDYVNTAVESYIGLLHNKPTAITLPPEMEFMRENATITGDSLDNLLRRIHAQQLVAGRVGLLLDIDSNATVGKPMPYLAMYHAENIINWDDGDTIAGKNALNLVVLDESNYYRSSDFTWYYQNKYRILVLGNTLNLEDENSGSYYRQAVSESQSLDDSEIVIPMMYSTPLQEIPFVFINTKDILSVPDVPPLLGLARACLSIYRAEADYRHTLYMQGQETLVVIGGNNNPDEDTRVGAGSKIDIHVGGDAKFIGVSSSGLSEMRQSLENDRSSAQAKAGQMLNSKSTQESGDALRLRMVAQTANMTQLAITASYGLEKILKLCAVWMKCDPDLVSVTPNLDFVNTTMHGQDFVQLMQAISMGLPLQEESVHDILRTQKLTTRSYAEESKAAKKEREAKLAAEAAMKAESNSDVTDGEVVAKANVTNADGGIMGEAKPVPDVKRTLKLGVKST
jgi:hypothetical protein